jgi:hypothetical protein
MLSQSVNAAQQLGMSASHERAVAKLLESFPDGVREQVQTAREVSLCLNPALALMTNGSVRLRWP